MNQSRKESLWQDKPEITIGEFLCCLEILVFLIAGFYDISTGREEGTYHQVRNL